MKNLIFTQVISLIIIGIFFLTSCDFSEKMSDKNGCQLTKTEVYKDSDKFPVLRYKFSVGNEYIFEEKYELAKNITQLFVTKQNPDKSWRIIVCETGEYGVTNMEEKVSLSHFDIFSDGRTKSEFTEIELSIIRKYFPVLPKDNSSAEQGWNLDFPIHGYHYKYKYLKTSSNKLVIEGHCSRPCLEPDTKYFEVSQLPIIFEDHQSTNNIVTHNLPWITKLNEEYEADFATNDYSKFNAQLQLTLYSDVRKKLLSEADERKSRVSTLQHPVILKAIKNDPNDNNYKAILLTQQTYYTELTKKVPLNWQAEDFNGLIYNISDFKGKIILLDFWYSTCGPCLAIMPQLKALAKEFKNYPFVIIGMNIDKNKKDALRIMKELDINCLTLKAVGIFQRYEIRGFPSLILIDQLGRIRYKGGGSSPHLYKMLSAKIRYLLKNEYYLDLSKENNPK